jgi:hypothetical protein
VVQNRYREPQPGFWKRNREVIARDIFIGIIVAAVSVLLTLALINN